MENLKLIVGLGNPGKEYENTYHNVGALASEYLAKHLNESRVEVLISDSFMNESGIFVSKIMRKHGTLPAQLLIAHDDSDLTIGDYKLAFGQSSAGHKGVQNIIDALGTQDFWRLRIGIRAKEEENPASLKLRRAKASEFVLRQISKKDREELEKVFVRAGEQIAT